MSVIAAADGTGSVDLATEQVEQMIKDAFSVGFAAGKTARPDDGFTKGEIEAYLKVSGEDMPDHVVSMILAVVVGPGGDYEVSRLV